jgi:hypothetical protein
MEIQSILFERSIWNLKNAKIWLLKHNYKTNFYGKQVDITPNYFRFRQTAPKYATYKTKSLNNGIILILGKH